MPPQIVAFILVLGTAVDAGATGTAAAETAAAPGMSTPAPAAPANAVTRVFFPSMSVGSGTDQATVALFEERILASARRHPGYTVLGARDVKALVDAESSRQAGGCTSDVDCAAEIAGALDAQQLLTGQIGGVGNTWVLTLTRADRGTLDVKARVVREARGATPEALLATLDGAVDELFGAEAAPAGPGPLLVVGAVTAGIGAAALVVGAGTTLLSWQTFSAAESVLNDGGTPVEQKQRTRDDAVAQGGALNGIATASWVVGGVLVVGGAVLALTGWANE